MKTKKVTDFLNTELKEYSMDVVECRAIPSVIDGLKPTARKVIYVADKKWKKESDKPLKVFQICGQIASEAYYHHGDSSLNSCITGMGQKFKNNLPLLEGIGQYGTLRSPEAGAPRYISTKLSENFRLLYKDFELLENKIDEGVIIEPNYFLPIIPTVIINGGSGIAVGFATNILNRNPKEVTQSCIDYLNGKKVKELKPWLTEFYGEYVRDTENKNKWYSNGIYNVVNTNTVRVTELPPDITFEKYESYLDSLIEKKKIVTYENNSAEKVDYTIKFKREDLAQLQKEGKLIQLLKLQSSETENLTTIDENGKLKIFDCAEDIVRYFVDFRLGWYQKRKDYWLNRYENELLIMSNKAKFIKAIIDKKLVVNNTPKEKVVSYLETNKFDMQNGTFDYLLNLPIYTLTKEKYNALLEQCDVKKKMIAELKKKEIRDMYIEDLTELKKKLK